MEYRQALAAGTMLASEYRIISTLRQDGFCITYDVEDLQIKSHVLIKEYFPAEIADRVRLSTVRPLSTRQVSVLSWGRQRFIEEVQTLGKFSHSGIARVKRVFEENNTAYAVIEAEDWPTLMSWADKQRRQLTQNELDQVAKQLLDSLDLLHDANVLVRDLSPESIYIRDKRELVLVDFGTAKSQLAARARKMHAVVRPGYSAPEQYLFDDQQQGPWTDIFSLGAVLYRLSTGRSPVEVIHRHHSDDMPKAVASHTKAYRLEFLQAIDKAMSLAPGDRPQTAKAFRALLLDPPRAGTPVKPLPATPVSAADAPEPAITTPSSPHQQTSAAQELTTTKIIPGSASASEPSDVVRAPIAERPVGQPQSTQTELSETANPSPSEMHRPTNAAPASGSTANEPAITEVSAVGSTRTSPRGPAEPRIPASLVPSALLSEKASAEDRLGFTLPDAEPESDPEPVTTGLRSAEKENPVKLDPARKGEIEAMAVSNRRFMIAVVGIIGALIGIIGLGLVTLERTLRPQAQTETASGSASTQPAKQPAQSEQERQRDQQKALFEDAERKRRETERANEQRRAADAELKRKDEEAAKEKRLAEDTADRQRAEAAQRQVAEEAAAKKRRDDDAAELRIKAAEAARQKLLADTAAEKKRTEEASRLQKAADDDVEKKRRDDEATRQKAAAEEQRNQEAQRVKQLTDQAAEQKRRADEMARQKQAADEAAQVTRRADEAIQRQRLTNPEADRKLAEVPEQRRLAEEAMRQQQIADEVEQRRQQETARVELKRLAEEAERRRRQQVQKDDTDRQKSEKNRQAEEAQRIIERQRTDMERQFENQVASISSREQLLRIASQNPERRDLVERRLVELGFLRVVATTGELWRKPGAGEAFQDCPTCPAVVVVPAGEFLMGSPQDETDRQDDEDDTPGPGGSQVRVTITRPFAVSKLEITRAQFAIFISETKHKMEGGCFVRVDAFELFPDHSWQSLGFPQTDEHPVACVSWLDVQAYAAWLSKKTGHTYRLLTEAEWEYAARGAPGPTVQPRFPFRGSEKDLCAFGNGADLAARKVYERWRVANCNDGYDHTAPGGSFEPNATGLHDMLGNLWEWVDDCYRDSHKAQGVPRRAGAAAEICNQDLRVLRGGSWSDPPDKLRPTARIAIPGDKRIQIGGFRLAREL